MKFFATLFFIALTSLSGATWSNMQKSGFNQAWERTKQFSTKENEKIEQYWINEIQPLIEKIAEQVRQKEENIKTLKALEIEINLSDREILFLLEQEKQLLGNEANAKGVK
ncbi:hypothetical protein LMG7974_01576 [Campylobacter majalis]|uniref:DUF1104 domain-containing protein n=1 Tax=Campylobacter majalis TaxID=2790656 RepID=A0ABM8Q934_9BACT|nr:hypothetical protein [Campylobacter majalis]CAD7289499.1 hypothetical protein LMG7974_01576 [Campylobacter majalis]